METTVLEVPKDHTYDAINFLISERRENCLFFKKAWKKVRCWLLISVHGKWVKGDYPRTRANDSKHLPAVILNVFFFFSEYTRVLCNINLKNKFHLDFLWNKLLNVRHFWLYIIKCFVEFKLLWHISILFQ